MLCEKCKNKKATLFYADEGGVRHSLCTLCASRQGKAEQISTVSEEAAEERFIPSSSLFSFSIHTKRPQLQDRSSLPDACKRCGTKLSDIMEKGIAGCGECYEIFLPCFTVFAPISLDKGARMPNSHRKSIERAQEISKLKSDIKQAVEAENYELAAALRDKIKKLENNDIQNT